MFEIKVEAQFKADYKRAMQSHPQLKTEFKAAVAELAAHGVLPAEYGAHELSTRAAITTVTSIFIFPMAWSTWSFSTCRIKPIR